MANIEIFGTLIRNDNNTNKDKIVQGKSTDSMCLLDGEEDNL